MPKHKISPSTRFFPHKERYEIFDGNLVEKFKIFVQDFVPIRTALKGGIPCTSQVFPWHFYFMREHSLVELTEHDDSTANIIVHSMYTYVHCCIHSTY